MSRFAARLRQHYQLKDFDLLVLEADYEGDVGPGDDLSIELPEGGTQRFQVHDVAWGSAVTADNPPLTLIVKKLDIAAPPAPGARIR